MKKFYLIALLFSAFFTQAQIVNIPDTYFKDALVNTACVDTDGDDYPDSDADLNNDGEIQVSEAEAILSLYVNFENSGQIVSLEGIEDFINLVKLDCSQNQITSLNVTQNTNLETLLCGWNLLTSLDVAQNPNLNVLSCIQNSLTSLDVTQNNNLQQLWCDRNQLVNLDVTQNTNLERLYCGLNQLTSLNITQNLNLDVLHCYNNQLIALDVTQNTNLLVLLARNNQLTSLNVTQNTNLISLECRSGQLTILDVTQNPNLERLDCSDNQLTSLNVTQNPNLRNLWCHTNQLVNLDVSQNTNLGALWCENNQLSSLNVKNGNNINMTDAMQAQNNPSLTCIQVDDETASYPACGGGMGWCKDSTAVYREDCSLGLEDYTSVSFTMSPNPTQNVLSIQSKENVESIKIFSLEGQLIKEISDTSIDVSALSNGLYFARVFIEGRTFTKKFIKI